MIFVDYASLLPSIASAANSGFSGGPNHNGLEADLEH
jgi:hypothetical protein